MHEIFVVSSIIDAVTESLAPYSGAQVKEVRLRVGVLAAVTADSLRFCYGVAIENTRLAGSALQINLLPVIVHCDPCGQDVELASVQSFRCPRCGTPTMDLRQGRELEIESIEIDEVKEDIRT